MHVYFVHQNASFISCLLVCSFLVYSYVVNISWSTNHMVNLGKLFGLLLLVMMDSFIYDFSCLIYVALVNCSYCGSLEPMPMPAGNGSIAHALFVSKDRRIPKIRIQTRQLGNLLDKRIIVAVDSWDCLSRYPSGHYVRTIGEIGDRDTESEVCRNFARSWMTEE